MANDVATINQALPNRRWTFPVTITLSDTTTAKNLYVDVTGSRPYRFIMNIGTSGLVSIFWLNNTTVPVWLVQGGILEGGYWVHAKTTGTDAGVSLLGLIGMEGRSQ